MAEAKRIRGVEPTTPLDQAVKIILDLRFEALRKHLMLAKKHAREDPEHVHQLRVAARRAEAAVREFSDCLPSRTARRLRRAAKRLRKTAGRARDWDVFLLDLSQRSGLGSAKDFLVGYALGQRAAAQLALDEEQGFKPRCKVKGGDGHVLSELATVSLAERRRALEAAMERDLDDPANLHQARIEGKKLRYAMELYAGCFDRDRLDALTEMQSILGNANDSRWILDQLENLQGVVREVDAELWDKVKPGFASLILAHKQQISFQKSAYATSLRKWREMG